MCEEREREKSVELWRGDFFFYPSEEGKKKINKYRRAFEGAADEE